MDNYFTLTTEEVRDGYASAYWYESDEDEVRKREAFNRWLAKHDNEVREAERERLSILEAAALIKGEK